MFSFLLLLLFPHTLAHQVCLEITDGAITTSVKNVTNLLAYMRESPYGQLECTAYSQECIPRCDNFTSWNETEKFNTSRFCFESNATRPPLVEIDMHQYSNCTLHICTNPAILPLVETLDSECSTQDSMKELFQLRKFCPELFRIDRQIKAAFIKAEKKGIHNMMNVTEVEAGDPVNFDMSDINMVVVNISEVALNSSYKTPELPPLNGFLFPDIWLPINAINDIPKDSRKISLVSYGNHSQFLFEEEEIRSMVIRLELLEGQCLRHLTTPIKMTFTVDPNLENGSRLECQFFDENELCWKRDGCSTSGTKTNITCYCDHATPFAVLLIREPISKVHWEILSVISYIGCGLSAFFTACSLLIFVFGRRSKNDYSMSIHVSLSGSLFLLNTTFLLTEWGATVRPLGVCVAVAALMHYSLLCVFTWMAIEALHLYLLLIKVFNTMYKRYMLKLSLAGWGIPAVIVTVSLAVMEWKQFYGLKEMTMTDTNQTSAICWITDDSFFYSVNLVYFTLIFVFNSGILLAVASNICRMKQVFRSHPKAGSKAGGEPPEGVACQSAMTVMGLTCLLGTSWGLAFLGSGYVNYVILYLFCILNSMQGFFIFLWIYLTAKKQEKRRMEEKLTSNPVKTSAAKFD